MPGRGRYFVGTKRRTCRSGKWRPECRSCSSPRIDDGEEGTD